MVDGVESIQSTVRDWRYRIGWILSSLAILFLVMDSTMKLLALNVVLESGAALGFTGVDTARGLGIVLILCTILYAVPRTTVLGAILLTGFLGGAVATHVRVEAGWFDIVFPAFFGALLWGGLWLRDRRLREMLPLRTL